jgi:hypothetical protein
VARSKDDQTGAGSARDERPATARASGRGWDARERDGGMGGGAACWCVASRRGREWVFSAQESGVRVQNILGGRTSPRVEIVGAKICYVLPTDCPM